jgi:hypothetical protein
MHKEPITYTTYDVHMFIHMNCKCSEADVDRIW